MSDPFAPLLQKAPKLDAKIVGYVCVSPAGQPHWQSAWPSYSGSAGICFGSRSVWELQDLADEGWRIVGLRAVAPCDEPPKGEDAIAAEGRSPASAVGESRGARE